MRPLGFFGGPCKGSNLRPAVGRREKLSPTNTGPSHYTSFTAPPEVVLFSLLDGINIYSFPDHNPGAWSLARYRLLGVLLERLMFMSRTRILPLYLMYWALLVLYLITWGNLSCEYPAFFDDGAFYSMAYAHNAGLNFYDGIVDTKPPLLIYLTSLGFRLSPSISFIKWLSVAMFGILILVVYLTLRYTSGRSDIACFGATLIATNWSLRHYGVVELSQSYWQTMLSLFTLIAVFGALSIRHHIPKFNASHRILAYVSLFFGGSIWAIAFYTKQQSIVVLPAVVALILLYSWSFQTLKERFYYLSIFAIGAIGSVLLLYYPILGNSPVAESYKYIFLSNMASKGNMALNDY